MPGVGASAIIDNPVNQPPRTGGSPFARAALTQVPADMSGEWVQRAIAAKALGISTTHVSRKAKQGKIDTCIGPSGTRLYKLTAAAIRELAKARNRANDAGDISEVAQAIAAGETVESLCVRGIPPATIAKALKDYRAAMVELRAIQADQRQAEDAAMQREADTGSPMVPASFAWLATKLATVSHAEAVEVFAAWRADGGDAAIVSPFVNRALASPDAWREMGARWAYLVAQRHAAAQAEALRLELDARKAIARANAEVQRLDRTDAIIEAAAARIEGIRESTRIRRKTEERTAAKAMEEKRRPREGNSGEAHIEAERAPRTTKKPPGSFRARMAELEAKRRGKEAPEDEAGEE